VIDYGGLASAPATVTIDVAGCGNGQVDTDPDLPREECDDGNNTPNDGCENNCQFTCGSNGDNIIPSSVVVDPETGHCFAIYDDASDFDSAAIQCQAAPGNAHLATIRSQSEQDAVRQLVGSGEAWLGGSDRESPADFRWVVTGEPFTFQAFGNGQPSNAQDADCLAQGVEGWFDSDCAKQQHYICEFNDGGVCGDGELNPGEECEDGNDQNGDGCENDCSFTCGSGSGATLSVAIGTHCFAGYSGTTDFGGATERCQTLGAHLATAASTEENEGILKIAGILPAGTGWIGAIADGQGDFQWVVDEPFEFRAFAQNEPTFKPNEDCVIATGVGWLDTLCDGSDAGAPGAICEFELQPDPIAPFHDDVFVNLAKYGTLTR
jgi:cysteine-rich repeat protein